MIDEKKLIKDYMNNYLVKNDGTWNDAMDRAVELAKTAPKVGEWIPVSERLPETEDKVMCCTETNKGNKNIVIGYYMDGAWRCGMNSNVIAWMPLPEPYKGESK